MGEAISIAAAAVSVLGSVVVVLWVAKWKAERETLHANMRTLQAEARACIAESANALFKNVNSSYVSTPLHAALTQRVDRVERRIDGAGD